MSYRLLHALHPEPRRAQLRAQRGGGGRGGGRVRTVTAVEAVAEVEKAIPEPSGGICYKNGWS